MLKYFFICALIFLCSGRVCHIQVCGKEGEILDYKYRIIKKKIKNTQWKHLIWYMYGGSAELQ